MRILFLSRWYPYPADNGSKIRVMNLLAGLCRANDVTLLSFCDPDIKAADGPQPFAGPAQIQVLPYRGYNPRSPRAVLGFFSTAPRFLIDTRSQQMAQLIAHTVRESRFELVIASQIDMASYEDCFRGTPAIFEEVELSAFRPDPVGHRFCGTALRQSLSWGKLRQYVRRLTHRFRGCTVASEVERQLLLAAAPSYSTVEVVPNCVEVDEYDAVQKRPARNTLIFTGSFRHAPNYEGLAWFLDTVYPSVRAEVPEVRLTVTGDHGGRPHLNGPGVHLTGHVRDIRPAVASSAAAIVPILRGGGTRVKILEAMALRTPVVTTAKGAEGLDVRHAEHVLIADSPKDFGRCAVSLLRDPEYARSLAERAYSLVRTHYDAHVGVSRLLGLVDRASRGVTEVA